MTVSPIDVSRLSQQLDLIREIARNLVGEAGPAGPPPPAAVSPQLPPAQQLDGESVHNVDRSDEPAEQWLSNAARLLEGSRPVFGAHMGSATVQRAQIRNFIELLAKSAAGLAYAAQADTFQSGKAGSAFDDHYSGPTGIGQSEAERPGRAGNSPGMPISDAATDSIARTLPSMSLSEPGAQNLILDNISNADLGKQIDRRSGPHNAPLATTAQTAEIASATDVGAHNLSRVSSLPDGADIVSHFDRSLQSELITQRLTALGFGEVALYATGASPERAGIIASFVLNAHFLPGWPPLRPIQGAQVVAEHLAISPQLSDNDKEMLVYLANFGLNAEQIARILKLALRAQHRSRLFAAITVFLSNFATMVRLFQQELASMMDDLGAESQVRLRTGPDRRIRTDLNRPA